MDENNSLESINPEVPNSPESIIPVPEPSLAETLKALLAPMQEQITRLADTNKVIKEENEKLREELTTLASNPIPAHLQGDDFPVNPNAARSVVIATRPVMDNPEKYRSKTIVDTGGLIRNDASPLSGKNRE